MRTIRFYTWNGIRQTRNGYAHVKRTAMVLVNTRQAVPPVYSNNLHSRTRKLNSNKTITLPPDRGSRKLVGLINSMKISFGYSITREYRIFIHLSNIARNIRRRKPSSSSSKNSINYTQDILYTIFLAQKFIQQIYAIFYLQWRLDSTLEIFFISKLHLKSKKVKFKS